MTTPAPPSVLARREFRPVGLRIVQALAAAAFGLCVYLLRASIRQSGPLGCGTASGCGHALASPWSRWLGVPVAALAAGLYLAILVAARLVGRDEVRLHPKAASVLVAASIAAGGAAVWFIALQVIAVGLCPYCLAVQLCGIVLCVVVLSAPARAPFFRPPRLRVPTLAAAVGLAALIGGQLLFRRPTYQIHVAGSQPPRSENGPPADPVPHPWFNVPGGRFDLDSSRVPVVGSPSARHLIVALTDYACPHCRSTHPVLGQLRRAYGDDIALVVLPTPLDRACNPLLLDNHPPEPQDCALNRLALAVWCADPKAFARMDEWLFAGGRARREDEAREYAAGLVGAPNLKRAEADYRIAAILRQDAEIYARCNGGALPKLLFGSTTVSGAVDDYQVLVRPIEKEWGVRPIGP